MSHKPNRLLAQKQFTQSYHNYMSNNKNDDDQQKPARSRATGNLSAYASSASLNSSSTRTAAPSDPTSRLFCPDLKTTTTTAISAQELKEFREMFNFARRADNHRDTRDRGELKYLMDVLNLNPTEEELDNMMKEVDADNSGDVDFEEWCAVMSKTTPFHVPSGKLRQALRMFQHEEREGFCSNQVLKDAIEYYCADQLHGDGELDGLLTKLDPGRSGTIKIDDFMSIIEQSEKAVQVEKQQAQMINEQQRQLQLMAQQVQMAQKLMQQQPK